MMLMVHGVHWKHCMGRAKSVRSAFLIFYVDRMVEFANFNRIRPMIIQMETHIYNQQKQLKEYADKYGIQLEAWAPF